MLSELAADACLTLLASVPVGRVGLSIDALPVVLPVNFAVVDGEVVFRTVVGTKFHAAVREAVVAFEADGYEPSGVSGWSVLVLGTAVLITDPDEIARLSKLTVDPWAVDGSADRFVRIRTARITGRRFTRPSPS